ncbi:hypothetical protein VRB67_21025 [Pseudomonas trivialis]|uniref:hypothetical protein n=1 Tax=Pseudomonas trivialis TaxID=200450 RepID=UPI0030CC1553
MPIKKIFISPKPAPATPSVPLKVPSYAPAGSHYNNAGKLVNRQGQLLNDKGQAINKKGYLINENNHRINDRGQLLNHQGHAVDDKGRLINNNGHLVNSYGKLINEAGRPVDTQGRLVNRDGRLVDPKGQLIDKDGKFVNKEGILIDKIGRPLDKDGKVARDLSSAAKGNNEPHEQLFPASVLKGVKKWQKEIPAPAAAPKLTIAEAVTRMSDADKMVKAGVISTSPSGAAVARDAAIGAAVTGLVSAPINIGAYAGSTAAAERIKASYLPVTMTPPTPIAKSSVELTESQEAIDVEALYPRMNEAQIIAFSVTNQSMWLKYGDTSSVLLPQQEWPTEPLARLKNLENMLDHAELHTKEVADEHEVYFKAYLPAVKAAEGLAGADARLVAVESRIASLQKAQGKVLEGMKLRQSA